MTDRLFAYGTLKPVARQRGGRPAHIYGRLWDNGHYPAARLGEPGGPMIAGLAFEVTSEELAAFDAREDIASGWYRRIRTRTLEHEEVWVYEGGRCIDGGQTDGTAWRPVTPDERGIGEWKLMPLHETTQREH